MTLRHEHCRDREALRIRLGELAGDRVRYDYRRQTVEYRLRRATAARWPLDSGLTVVDQYTRECVTLLAR